MPPKKTGIKVQAPDTLVSLGETHSISEQVAAAFELTQDGQSGAALEKLVVAFTSNADETTAAINQCLSLTLGVDEKNPAVAKVREFIANAIQNLTADEAAYNVLISSVLRNLAEFLTNPTKVNRVNACTFLGAILHSLREDADLDADIYEYLQSRLLDRLQDKQTAVRENAVLALRRFIEDDIVIEKLVRTLSSDPAAEVRLACVKEVPRQDNLPTVLERIHDVDPTVRKAVCKQLEELRKPLSTRYASHQVKVDTLATALADREKSVSSAALLVIFKWLQDRVKISELIDHCKPAENYASCERIVAAVVGNAKWSWHSENFTYKLGVPVYSKTQKQGILTATGLPSVVIPMSDYAKMLEEDTKALDEYEAALAEDEDTEMDKPTPQLTLADVMIWRLLIDAAQGWPLPGYGSEAHLARLGNDTLADVLMPTPAELGKALYFFREHSEIQRELLLIARHVDCTDEFSLASLRDNILDILENGDTQESNVPLFLTLLRLTIPEDDGKSSVKTDDDNDDDNENKAPVPAPQRRVRLHKGSLRTIDTRTSQRLTSNNIGDVLRETNALFHENVCIMSAEGQVTRSKLCAEIASLHHRICTYESSMQAKHHSLEEVADALDRDPAYMQMNKECEKLEKEYRTSVRKEMWMIVRLLLLAHNVVKFANHPIEDTLQLRPQQVMLGAQVEETSLQLAVNALWFGLSVDYYSADVQSLCIEIIALIGSLSTQPARVYSVLALLLSVAQPDGYIAPPPCAATLNTLDAEYQRHACVGPSSFHAPNCPCNDMHTMNRAHGNVTAKFNKGCFGSIVHPRVVAVAVAGICDVLLAHEGLFTGEDTETIAHGDLDVSILCST